MTSNRFFRDSGTASARRSEVAVLMKRSMKSRIVSQSAVNVPNPVRGVRC